MYHNIAPTAADSIVASLTAGVDMSMVPEDLSFPAVLAALVANGTIPEARLDESVTRILQLKIDLGLFDTPVVPPALANFTVGSAWAQGVALNATRESLTLLKNGFAPAPAAPGTPLLPLQPWLAPGGRIAVIGPAAVDLTALCGGWTIHWQGARAGGACPEAGFAPGVGAPLGDAVAAAAAPRGVAVTVVQGANFSDASPAGLAAAAAAAASADVIVLALGEAPESETPGNTPGLELDPAQAALFAAVNATGKPIVTVLVEPRPRILGAVADGSAAIIMAYLPCVHGGTALAEALFGDLNPSGRLPITYPRTTGDLDVYYHKPHGEAAPPWDPDTDPEFHNPLFQFGTGLSYSALSYAGLAVTPAAAPAGAVFNVTVTVSNAGPFDAKDAVLVFVRQLYRAAITPEQRALKGFTKVDVAVGAAVTVTVPLPADALSYWTPSLERVIDAGEYVVMVGNLSVPLTVTTPGVFEWAPRRGEAAGGGWAVVPAGGAARAPPPHTPVDAVLSELGDLRATGPVARSVAMAGLRDRVAAALGGGAGGGLGR
jgi:beta-glucosidase